MYIICVYNVYYKIYILYYIYNNICYYYNTIDNVAMDIFFFFLTLMKKLPNTYL